MKTFLHKNALWLLAFALIWFGVRSWQQADMAEGPLPVRSLPTLSGKTVDLHALPKPLLIHFTASWCPICQLQHDTLKALSKDWTVIQIITQSGNKSVTTDYAIKHDIPLDYAVYDPEGQLLKIFGAQAVPADFYVGKDNLIHFHDMGYTSLWGYQVRLWLLK